MPKLKKLLPGIFGTSKAIQKNTNIDKGGATDGFNNVSCVERKGMLEMDALPVEDENVPTNNNNTPTHSTELSESVVHELSNPNYNSENVTMNVNASAGSSVRDSRTNALPLHTNNNAIMTNVSGTADELVSSTTNTMNIHNAQQQMVMQFSNIKQLHFGSVYNFSSNLNAAATNTRKNEVTDVLNAPENVFGTDCTKRSHPRKTTTIVTMMQSQEEPNHHILDAIATHLGEGWKLVMRKLGHSEGQIEQALIDHQMHGGIKEVIYQLLLQWLHDADDGVATLGHITTVLWESNHRECVQRMKLVYKLDMDRRHTTTK